MSSTRGYVLSVWLLVLGVLSGAGQAQALFAGNWLTSWSASGEKTTAYISIETGGRVSGTVLNTTKGTWATLSGSVAGNGNATASFTYPGYSRTTLSGFLRTAGRNIASDLTVSNSGQRIKPTLKPNAFGGSTAPAPALVGTWSGTWKSTEVGNAELTFDLNGTVSGRFENLSADLRGSVSGTTTPQGDFYGTVTYEGGNQRRVVATFKVSSKSASATFVQDMRNGSVFKAPLSLRKGPLPSRENLARLVGRWKGSWAGDGQRGTTDLFVEADGTVFGSVKNNTVRLTGPLTGRVNPDGSFTGTLRYPTNTLRITGLIERWGDSTAGVFSDGGIDGPFILKRSR